MSKNCDFRIKKTNASLFRSLIKLLDSEDYDKISISKLCSLSNINRTTFYDHYKDKDELLYYFINELFNKSNLCDDLIIDNNSLLDYTDSILKLIEKNIIIFNSLIKSDKTIMIRERIIISFISRCNLDDDLCFFIGGISNLIVESLKNNSFDRIYLYSYARDLSLKLNLFQKK